ncbi:MAG: TetR/AcrR family transcriptional regulator [Parvibaculum sp.]|nr:TetR/AcrR family transcriptional regulator [Parvibaculum sp.]
MQVPQKIIDAAVDVFGRHGYRQANIGVIAERAGMSRQALYRYFDGKEALYRWITEDMHVRALSAAKEAAKSAQRSGEDAAQVLFATLRARYAPFLDLLHLSPHANEFLEENNRLCGDIATKHNKKLLGLVAAVLDEEAESGRLGFAEGMNARDLARIAVSLAVALKSGTPPPSSAAFGRDLERALRLLVAGSNSVSR